MMSFLPYLLKYWRFIALIGAVLVIFAYHQYRSHQISSLTKENIELKVAIETYRTLSEQQKAQMDKNKVDADKVKRSYDQKIKQLSLVKVDNTCEAMYNDLKDISFLR